jgi:hypothetical protein
MTGRHWAWGAGFAVPVILALVWLVLPAGSEPEQGGVIKIAASAPSPAAIASPAMTARAGRSAIVATQPQVDLADDQSFRVAREKRDRAWAERSEGAIGNLMRGIAYVGGKRRLHIACAATVCEVTGIADPDPVTNSYQPVWEALERDTAGTELSEYGLERTAAIFDTGRNPDEFKILYRRAEAPPKP